METYSEDKIVELRTERKSLEGRKSGLTSKANETLKSLGNLDKGRNKRITEMLNQRLEAVENEIGEIEEKIADLDLKINGTKQIALSKDEFTNLLKTLPDKIENASVPEKDAILRIMLSNLTIDNEKRAHYLWKEPFNTLVKTQELDSGEPGGTRTLDTKLKRLVL